MRVHDACRSCPAVYNRCVLAALVLHIWGRKYVMAAVQHIWEKVLGKDEGIGRSGKRKEGPATHACMRAYLLLRDIDIHK